MDIGTSNADYIVNVGSASGIYSLYSTATVLMGRRARRVSLGLSFLRDGTCNAEDCTKALRQLHKINDELARHSPSDAIWDLDHPDVSPPWMGNLAPTVTSCADLYTTSEGELMLPELMSLLEHAAATKQGVVVLG